MREQPQVKVLAFNTFDSTFLRPLATGTVLALDNQIDPSSGTFKIKAVFDNQDEALFPNQLVNVKLLVDTRKNVVVVPSQAVQQAPESPYVDVIKPDMTVEQRTVKSGATEGGNTVITQGLAEGELVATVGLDRLDNGTKVILQAADARAGAATSRGRARGGIPGRRRARGSRTRRRGRSGGGRDQSGRGG